MRAGRRVGELQKGGDRSGELTKVKDHQHRAEMELLAESQAFAGDPRSPKRRSPVSGRISPPLRQIIPQIPLPQAQRLPLAGTRHNCRPALCMAFFFAPQRPPSGFAATGNPVTVPGPQDLIRKQRVAAVSPPLPAVPAVARALDRLDGAQVRVSSNDVESVLRSANRWLALPVSPVYRRGRGRGDDTARRVRRLGHKPLSWLSPDAPKRWSM